MASEGWLHVASVFKLTLKYCLRLHDEKSDPPKDAYLTCCRIERSQETYFVLAVQCMIFAHGLTIKFIYIYKFNINLYFF